MIKGSLKKGMKKEVVVRKEHHIQGVFHIGHNTEMQVLENSGAYEAASRSKKVKAMPTEFTKLPFALPGQAEDQERINKILKFSLKQQKEDEISDNPELVNILISRCLSAANIQHRIVRGYRVTHSAASHTDDNPMRFPMAPHVWLLIQDYVIDNTYIKHMPEKCCKYLQKHTPGCYTEVPDYLDFQTFEDAPDAECLPRTAMRRKIEYCMGKPDLVLALAHNNEHFYNFFFTMIRYMYEEHGVTVMGIDPNIRFICWHCENYPEKREFYTDSMALRLSRLVGTYEVRTDVVPTKESDTDCSTSWRYAQCSRCMVANYCSKDCQQRDWNLFHKTMCLSRGSVFLPPISDTPYGDIGTLNIDS